MIIAVLIEVAAMVSLCLICYRPLSRFGDWFVAERGTDDGKNGWL